MKMIYSFVSFRCYRGSVKLRNEIVRRLDGEVHYIRNVGLHKKVFVILVLLHLSIIANNNLEVCTPVSVYSRRVFL